MGEGEMSVSAAGGALVVCMAEILASEVLAVAQSMSAVLSKTSLL